MPAPRLANRDARQDTAPAAGESTMTRAKAHRRLGICSHLVLMVISGLLLADHLTPPAHGRASAGAGRCDRRRPRSIANSCRCSRANPGQDRRDLPAPMGWMRSRRARSSARSAGRSLDLQYYIWHDDLDRPPARSRGLRWRAERGVRVRMLLDDINTEGLDAQLLALDAHPNIEVRLYNPFRNRSGRGASLELLQRDLQRATTACTTRPGSPTAAWRSSAGATSASEYFGAGAQVNFRDLDLLLFGAGRSQQAEQHLRQLLEQRRGGADRGAERTDIRRAAAAAAARRPARSAAARGAERYLRARRADRRNVRSYCRPQLHAALERPASRSSPTRR